MAIVFDDEQPKKSRIVFDDEAQPQEAQWGDVVGNAGKELKGMGQQVATLAMLPFKAPMDIYNTGKQMLQGQPFKSTPIGQQADALGEMTVNALPHPNPNGGGWESGSILRPYIHPIQSFKEAPINTLMAYAPIANRAIEGFSELPLVEKGTSAVGKGLSNAVEKTTKIPSESVSSTFNKPSSLFTAPNQKEVSAAYNASEFPQMTQSFDEAIQQATGSHAAVVKRGAKALEQFVQDNKENPKAILEGRKALDKQIAMLDNQIDMSNGSGRSSLLSAKTAKLNLRSMFNRALDQMAPKLRQADALASERLKVAPFRQMALPGKINFTSPEGMLRAVPGLPPIIGTGIAGAGAVAKGIGAIVSPAASTGEAIGSAINRSTDLTEEQAKKFWEQAKSEGLKGDDAKKRARQLAELKGLKWKI